MEDPELDELERHGDGLVVMDEWRGTTRTMVAVFFLVFLIVPWVIFASAFAFGLIIAGGERWHATLGFEYMLGNMLGLPKVLTQVTPVTSFGTAVEVTVSIWMLILTSSVIAHASTTHAAAHLAKVLRHLHSDLGLPTLTCAIIPPVVFAWLCFGLLLGWLMARSEGWDDSYSFLFMSFTVIGFHNSFTGVSPRTLLGIFIMTFIFALRLVLVGVLVRLISMFPGVAKLILKFEGSFNPEEDFCNTEDVDDLTSERNALYYERDKLTAARDALLMERNNLRKQKEEQTLRRFALKRQSADNQVNFFLLASGAPRLFGQG